MTEQQPLVSIVIPCYNHAQFVQETIQSVIDQDYENIELIIIDDGSKDNSVDVIQEIIPACKERFIRFEFRFRPNKGLCATLNEALEWCEGKYYSAIASDDVMISDKCSIQVEFFIENPEYDAVFGSAYIIDNNGKLIRKNKKKSEDVTFKDLFLVKKMVSAPTQMIKLDAIKSAGEYPVGEYIEDWYM
ncbi:MAG TPA: glycosyltransferase, partial [Thiopseudomonas sp.]|nr:glycosyltransferase [Thiopseudomonas sp.]